MDDLPPQCDHLVERRGKNYVVYRAGGGGSAPLSRLTEPPTLASGCRSWTRTRVFFRLL